MSITQTAIESGLAASALVHLDVIAGRPAPKQPRIGQSNTWEHDGIITRVGRRHETGAWYLDITYRVPEGYDDDYGSQTCADCRWSGRPHRHHVCEAETLAALRIAVAS